MHADAERALTEALSALDKGTYVEPSKLSLEWYLLDEWLPACAARVRATTVVVPPLHRAARLDGTPVHPNNIGQHFRRQIVKAGLR